MLTDEEYREKAGEAIFKGEEPPKVAEESPTEEVATEPLKEEIVEPEKIEKVPEEVTDPNAARWDNLTEMLSQFDTRIKETVGRVGAIQSTLDASAKQAKEEKNSAPTKEEMEIAAKNKETWDGLRTDFPEWAEAIDAKFAAERAGYPDIEALSENIREKTVAEVKGELSGEFEDKLQETLAQINERLVTAFHPGWQKTTGKPGFVQWLAGQPADEQQKYYSDDPVQAISLLDNWEESQSGKTVAEIKAERQATLDKAAKTETKNKETRPKAEDDMTDDEYRAKKAKEAWDD